MTSFFQAGGHYLAGLATIAGCFVLLGLGKASWAETGPVIIGVAGVLIGGNLGASGASATTTSAAATARSASEAQAPAGVGSAGQSG